MLDKVAIIDNYDSFTYNLVHALEPMSRDIFVMRNDNINREYLEECDALVLSPGPELPQTSGELMNVIEQYINRKPILGVCLGMQGLITAAGGELANLKTVRHGLQVEAEHNGSSLFFEGIPKKFRVGLYHSWFAQSDKIPSRFRVTADYQGAAMAVEHVDLPVIGVQFHPESVMTPHGTAILQNWTTGIVR